MKELEPNQTVKFNHTQEPCPYCGGKGYMTKTDERILTAEPDEE